jgi:hypothetical protein
MSEYGLIYCVGIHRDDQQQFGLTTQLLLGEECWMKYCMEFKEVIFLECYCPYGLLLP